MRAAVCTNPLARALAPLVVLGMALVGGLGGCKDKAAPLAELVAVSGPIEQVERASAGSAWAPARLGDTFVLGDAVRTKGTRAQLRLGDASRLELEPHTLLRFGRKGEGAAEQQLLVETGAIELAGSGEYKLDLGEISVERDGGVRISAGDTGNRVELLVGRASIRTAEGQVQPLERGVALELSDLEVRGLGSDARAAEPRDAGVPDAPPVPPAPAPTVAVSASGKGAEVRLAPGERWRALGSASGVPEGAEVRARAGGAATLEGGGVVLRLSPGGTATVGPGLGLSLTAGEGTARAAPGGGGEVALPGGKIALAPHRLGSRAELAVRRRESKVRGTGGMLTVHGRSDRVELRRGESASLAADGSLRTLAAAPRTHELSLAAGESVTIHDVRGAAAVQLRFEDQCSGGGVIELSTSASFRSPQLAAGEEAATLLVAAGSYHYRLRCESESGDGKPVASGRLAVVRDSGRRPLAAAPPPFRLAVDGRTYRVGYQGAIPPMIVEWRGATGSGYVLHLGSGGKVQELATGGPTATIPAGKLRDGSFTVWFERGGQRSKVSTLLIDFDNTAPAVYIDEPDDGDVWGPTLQVKGAVLPDWSVSVEGVAIPLDRQRRFSASVPAPEGALAIRLSHRERGVHYYLRRRK